MHRKTTRKEIDAFSLGGERQQQLHRLRMATKKGHMNMRKKYKTLSPAKEDDKKVPCECAERVEKGR